MEKERKRRRTPTTTLGYTTKGFQGFIGAERAELKIKEQERAEQDQLTTILLVIFSFLVAYVVLLYYDLQQTYGDFIQTVDQAGTPCSGLRIALCLRYPFINFLAGCTQNNNVPAAMWYLVHTKGLRQAAQTYYRSSPNPIGSALNAVYNAGFLDTVTDAHTLACAAVGNPLNPDCAPQCPLQTNFGGSSMGVATAQGAMNGAGIGLGLMVINPVVGAIAAGIGAIFGAVTSALEHKQQEEKIIQQCQAGRTNCYLPPNFPPCQGSP